MRHLSVAPPAGRLVYDPKVSVARSRWRRLLGMSMVFVVSGVMHEVMFL